MSLKFTQLGYNWCVREGFPPMGSSEVSQPNFVEAIRAASPSVNRYTDREVASWIVALLNYLTAGALTVEGDSFSHDTNEFGYKIKITDDNKKSIAHGAVVIHEKRTYFASVNAAIEDFQSVFVDLLTEYPGDLAKCEIRVQYPETKRYRSYGWDGYSLFT